jgi:hypothetical protein
MMEGISFSEMSVSIYQTAWWYNLEDSHLHARMLFTLVVTEDCMLFAQANASPSERRSKQYDSSRADDSHPFTGKKIVLQNFLWFIS